MTELMTSISEPSAKLKLSPRKRKSYGRLLKVAGDLLESLGYEEVSVREVADKAEVAPMTIYNLFGSKDGLLNAAIEFRTRLFIIDNPVIETFGVDGLEKINARIASACISSNRMVRSIATKLAGNSALYAVRRIYHDLYAALIKNLADRKDVVSSINAQACAYLMMINHNAALNVWASGEMPDEKLSVLFDLTSYSLLMPFAKANFGNELHKRYETKFLLFDDIDFDELMLRNQSSQGRVDIDDLVITPRL